MKSGSLKSGFTLIEMLVVVAVIVLLISMVVAVAKRIDDQGKERLCRNTIALIGNALEQFRDFGYEYKDANFAGLSFPLDCNDFPELDLEQTLYAALYSGSVNVNIVPDGINDPCYSGSEALYFILSQVPDCRKTLDKIDKSLVTNASVNGTPISIAVTSGGVTTMHPFYRIIDPWKTPQRPLRYDYYPDFADYPGYPGNRDPYVVDRNLAKRTFPVITSAGPDRLFDTADDISNAQPK